jgi:hypothetical protein
MPIVRDACGRDVAFEVARRHMDAALLEKVQAAAKTGDEQTIFEDYARAHAGKYHQSFAPYTGGRW